MQSTQRLDSNRKPNIKVEIVKTTKEKVRHKPGNHNNLGHSMKNTVLQGVSVFNKTKLYLHTVDMNTNTK